tara:strand:- start:268 stop:651 length:384 start_codon:yes stop_codon:yes gene_type:complete
MPGDDMSSITKKELDLVAESLYKLTKKVVTTIVTVKLERDTHVPDLMTRIRILPTVAVVGQKEKVARFMDGDALLTLSIKFLPRTTEIYGSLRDLSKMMKRLPGVKTVGVDSYNKKKITLRGKKIIF